MTVLCFDGDKTNAVLEYTQITVMIVINRREDTMEGCVPRGFFVLVFFFIFVSFFQMGSSQNGPYVKNFVSWDDVKVEKYGTVLSNRDDYNEVVVDQSGEEGHATTVQEAIDMVPEGNTQRVKIYIFPGLYREKVHVPSTKPYISFIGIENRTSDTVISWNDKASDRDNNGVVIGTYRSASVTVESDYFCAAGITFENTVVAEPGGVGMQAVALRVSGDKAFFYKVRILGSQDTLLDQKGSHYFYQCHIQGNVDFIFGNARSLFKDCSLQSTARESGAIAAHHRNSPNEETGFSFVGCAINGTGNILLGRAWGNYSRIIYSYCTLADIVAPSGWSDWNLQYRQKTVVFGEYECSGRGADTRGRVPWLKNFTLEEIRPFMGVEYIQGNQWLKL